jgi:hypothetical protein
MRPECNRPIPSSGAIEDIDGVTNANDKRLAEPRQIITKRLQAFSNE